MSGPRRNPQPGGGDCGRVFLAWVPEAWDAAEAERGVLEPEAGGEPEAGPTGGAGAAGPGVAGGADLGA